jgi:hypothetical protein
MAHARDFAETTALQALAWLAADDELFSAFLGASGHSPAEIRARAGDPVFLAAVLDFLLTDDAWVMAFCDSVDLGYDTPARARAGLPGGEVTHWT